MSDLVRLGVLRLADSAPVVVAQHRGLFAAAGLNVAVSVEPSWANIADKLTYRLLDAAVMLPPLVLATAAGMRGPRADLVVPIGISIGGNTVTLGHAAAAAVATRCGGAADTTADTLDTACHREAVAAAAPGQRDARAAARQLLAWMRAQPKPPAFAVVHRFSTHNLLLRAWLAEAGAEPERDWKTVIVPPEQIVAALADGQIAGFCAGAPWGDAAEQAQAGRILLGTSQIRPGHAEKCLAARASWASNRAEQMRRLLQALAAARALCNAPAEAASIAALLASPGGLGLPAVATRAAFDGRGEKLRFESSRRTQRHHARWFGEQMQRWGWWPAGADRDRTVDAIFGAE